MLLSPPLITLFPLSLVGLQHLELLSCADAQRFAMALEMLPLHKPEVGVMPVNQRMMFRAEDVSLLHPKRLTI